MATLINYFDDVESNLCLRINRLGRAQPVQLFFSIISKLGDGYFWVVLAIVCLLAEPSRAFPFILRALLTALLGIAIYRLLKQKLVRERPYVANTSIVCGTPPLDRYSFPSGHTLHAVSFAVLFTAYEPMLAVMVVPFAVLVALSRMVLGLHYPSDVCVGAAIGTVLASVSNAA